MFSLIERNDSLYNLVSISTEKYVIVNYATLYTGNKDDDLSSSNDETIVLPKLENWWFEEFTSYGFKMRINISNPLLVS